MKNKLDDSFFRKLAHSYVETEGRKLEEDLSPAQEAPVSLTERAKQQTKVRKARSSGGLKIGLLAAAIVVVLAVPVVWQISHSLPKALLNAPDATAEVAQSEEAELIPLSFTLPVNLSQTGSKLDNGQSIYYLEEAGNDDVVLVLEKLNQRNQDLAEPDKTPVKINGKEAYIKETRDYHYLAFTKDGILYTMTCKYDIDTLIALGEIIL